MWLALRAFEKKLKFDHITMYRFSWPDDLTLGHVDPKLSGMCKKMPHRLCQICISAFSLSVKKTEWNRITPCWAITWWDNTHDIIVYLTCWNCFLSSGGRGSSVGIRGHKTSWLLQGAKLEGSTETLFSHPAEQYQTISHEQEVRKGRQKFREGKITGADFYCYALK